MALFHHVSVSVSSLSALRPNHLLFWKKRGHFHAHSAAIRLHKAKGQIDNSIESSGSNARGSHEVDGFYRLVKYCYNSQANF